MKKLISGLTIASLVAMSGPAMADEAELDQNIFVFSANGPGEGKGAIGMGGQFIIIIPTFDINYLRGFTDDLDLTFNMSTLGIISIADLGARYRLFGSTDSGFAVGVKGAVTVLPIFIAAGGSAAGAIGFAATPGITVSFGGKRTQFSLVADFPLWLAGAVGGASGGVSDGGTTSGFEPSMRPGLVIEFPVGDTTNMYVKASGIIPLSAGTFFGPLIGVGAVW